MKDTGYLEPSTLILGISQLKLHSFYSDKTHLEWISPLGIFSVLRHHLFEDDRNVFVYWVRPQEPLKIKSPGAPSLTSTGDSRLSLRIGYSVVLLSLRVKYWYSLT